MPSSDARHFTYAYSAASTTHPWLDPVVVETACRLKPPVRDVLDLGCGNGAISRLLVEVGFQVTGVDPEETAIAIARREVPQARFVRAGVYDDPSELGLERFDLVVAVEVVEHLFLPRALPRFAQAVLRPGGHLLLTTPHYGNYVKNLICSVLNRWDQQFVPLWDGGHVKFWSPRTMTALLEESGFRVLSPTGVNRRTPLLRGVWPNSLLVVAQKR